MYAIKKNLIFYTGQLMQLTLSVMDVCKFTFPQRQTSKLVSSFVFSLENHLFRNGGCFHVLYFEELKIKL